VYVVFNNRILSTNGSFQGIFNTANYRDPGGSGNATYGFCDGSNVWDENAVGGSGYQCLDQTGAGYGDLLISAADAGVCSGNAPRNVTQGCTQEWPNQVHQPTYVWGNTENGVAEDGIVDTVNIQLDRDLYNSARPGYTAYTYPHPLTVVGAANFTGSISITGGVTIQ
jgi:hypothetical protein